MRKTWRFDEAPNKISLNDASKFPNQGSWSCLAISATGNVEASRREEASTRKRPHCAASGHSLSFSVANARMTEGLQRWEAKGSEKERNISGVLEEGWQKIAVPRVAAEGESGIQIPAPLN
ncbi:hypothetical protein QLX08_006525 [Tetragonisca angustula]|uniref:Uncharacterized protein n=1 Tax=Tetragonisca angustula TaxID=166442 RepID=A0AAW0ZWA4_9HYME